jgi:small subunit ribosomal protein S10
MALIQMQIHLKSYQLKFLQKALAIIEQKLLSTFHIHVQKTYKRKYTVLRSPHVHKKSREQFFLTEYHLIFSIDSNDPFFLISILKTISFYGVQIKMTIKSSSHLLLA